MHFSLMASILNFALRAARPCIEHLIAYIWCIIHIMLKEGMLSKLCWCAPLLFVLKPQFHTVWGRHTVERMDFKLTGYFVTVIWRQRRFQLQFIMVKHCMLCTSHVFTFVAIQQWKLSITLKCGIFLGLRLWCKDSLKK